MLWSDLKTRVCKPFGGSHAAEAYTFLEDAEKDISIFAKCYQKSFVTLMDEKSNGFHLPADFVEMVSRPDYDGTMLERYTEVGYASNKISSTQFDKGSPRFYRIEGSKMVLVPRPTDAKLLRFQYVAMARKLDNAKVHKRLNYSDLSGEGFRYGDVVEGRLSTAIGTPTATGSVESDLPNGDGTGTLILKNITNYGSYTGFRSGDTLVTIEAEQGAYTAGTPYGSGYSFSTLVDKWDEIGFGGKATIVGTEWAEYGSVNSVSYGTETGNNPIIPEPYHYLMIEYAQARIYDMLGQAADADRHYNRYYQNRTQVAAIVANEDFGGPVSVVDAL